MMTATERVEIKARHAENCWKAVESARRHNADNPARRDILITGLIKQADEAESALRSAARAACDTL